MYPRLPFRLRLHLARVHPLGQAVPDTLISSRLRLDCLAFNRLFPRARPASCRRRYSRRASRNTSFVSTAWRQCRQLRGSELFLLSAINPTSFDSRYFGSLAASAVIDSAQPLGRRARHEYAALHAIPRAASLHLTCTPACNGAASPMQTIAASPSKSVAPAIGK